MTGMVTAITTKTKGKQKLSQSLYNIQFLDNEKLRCGLETVKDMHASYVSCRAKFAQKTLGGTKAPQSLYPEGFDLYTTWMPEMSLLSQGCKLTAVRMGKFDSRLR
jgi:hypothetical protein